MIITYGGLEAFKLQFGDTILALNPASKDSKFKTPSFGADIAFVSLNHEDFNGVDTVSRGERQPFEISGPGEYEVKGIFIKGLESKSKYGGTERFNTIYTINLENMNLCFLGALGDAESAKAAREDIDDVDILFVPIGGEGVLNPADAYKFALSIEPRIMIPMHYGDLGAKDSLKVFLKEGGSEKVEAIDKLTVKRKDLEGKQGEIVVLSSS
jgi:L-ascorbate metabolism protein UlaG (beta-lactamase superfamily)